MPAQSVDPGIDEEREHEAVEGAAHDHAGEERQDELDPAHRAADGVDGADVPGGGNRESVWIGPARRHAQRVRAARLGIPSWPIGPYVVLPAVRRYAWRVPNMARATQRDAMRDLNRRFGGDYDKVVAAYAAAERRGEVRRTSNVHAIAPEEYARRLYADGVAKGWIA